MIRYKLNINHYHYIVRFNSSHNSYLSPMDYKSILREGEQIDYDN